MTITPIRPPQSRLRLTRRGRLVLTSLAAIPLVVSAASIAFGAGMANAAGQSPASASSFDYVQVGSGQSLWELAATIAPDADPRDVVSDVLDLNQLSSPDVQPGQQLAIPNQYRD